MIGEAKLGTYKNYTSKKKNLKEWNLLISNILKGLFMIPSLTLEYSQLLIIWLRVKDWMRK